MVVVVVVVSSSSSGGSGSSNFVFENVSFLFCVVCGVLL